MHPKQWLRCPVDKQQICSEENEVSFKAFQEENSRQGVGYLLLLA